LVMLVILVNDHGSGGGSGPAGRQSGVSYCLAGEYASSLGLAAGAIGECRHKRRRPTPG